MLYKQFALKLEFQQAYVYHKTLISYLINILNVLPSLLDPGPCRERRDMRGRGAARRLYSASVLGERQRGELCGEGE